MITRLFLIAGLSLFFGACDSDGDPTSTPATTSLDEINTSCVADSDCVAVSYYCCGCPYIAVNQEDATNIKGENCRDSGCPTEACEGGTVECAQGKCVFHEPL